MSSSSTQNAAEIHRFPAARSPLTEAPSTPPEEKPAAVPAEAPAPAPDETPQSGEPPAKRKSRAKRFLLPVIGLAILAGAGWYGYDYWIDGRFMISTDDAYVQADMAFVSPKVSGYVDQVKVVENQHVKAGDPLLVIDDGDFRIAVDQAEAQIVTQQKSLATIDAQIEAARATQKQAEAQKLANQAAVDNARRTFDRAQQLLKTHVGTQAQADDAQTALDQAVAALAGSDAAIAVAEANIGVLQAQHDQAASTLASLDIAKRKAERDLSFTVLKAPYDGVVGNVSVEQGDLVSPGQKLAAIVPVRKLYVVANFKETQLARIVPGEKVRITVDALGDRVIEGTVSSLSPASGAVFSLLPPENATGNFTKVVQRVPVRIDLPEDVLSQEQLRAGLSVVANIDSRTGPAVN